MQRPPTSRTRVFSAGRSLIPEEHVSPVTNGVWKKEMSMIQVRKVMAAVMAVALLLPAVSVALPQADSATASSSSAAMASRSQRRNRTSVLQHSRAVRRSSYQEAGPRRHHISRGEVAMMAAVAGTSMGIGAIAGGGTGLAIGALVGGWSAYAVHRLWNHIR